MLHVASRASDEIACLNREIDLLRCALADIKAMAMVPEEAKAIVKTILATSASQAST